MGEEANPQKDKKSKAKKGEGERLRLFDGRLRREWVCANQAGKEGRKHSKTKKGGRDVQKGIEPKVRLPGEDFQCYKIKKEKTAFGGYEKVECVGGKKIDQGLG